MSGSGRGDEPGELEQFNEELALYRRWFRAELVLLATETRRRMRAMKRKAHAHKKATNRMEFCGSCPKKP